VKVFITGNPNSLSWTLTGIYEQKVPFLTKQSAFYHVRNMQLAAWK